jgi:uncharacterized protein YdcH (DUF465 family)
MDFNRLKELARKFGGVLVLNGNSPEFIILSYEQYKKLETSIDSEENSGRGKEEDDEETIEKLNREILALKEEIRQKESAELAESAGDKELIANDSALF